MPMQLEPKYHYLAHIYFGVNGYYTIIDFNGADMRNYLPEKSDIQ